MDEDDGFLQEFERSVQSDLQRLGEQLYVETRKFISACDQEQQNMLEKGGTRSIDEYVICRTKRDAFMRKEMNNLSLRIKHVKHSTQKCYNALGQQPRLKHCSDTFKAKLNDCYVLAFNNFARFGSV